MFNAKFHFPNKPFLCETEDPINKEKKGNIYLHKYKHYILGILPTLQYRQTKQHTSLF